MTEETFGPTIVINPVRDLDEAVESGPTPGIMGSAPLSSPGTRTGGGRPRLRAGMVSINSWVMYAGVPALPWGGVGQSGFGRIHGADGLRSSPGPRAWCRNASLHRWC